MVPEIEKLCPNENKTLLLVFSTGEKKLFDVNPYITGPWFGELNDTAYFLRVRIINNGKGIAWPHGQDIAPHELYELSVPLSN